MIEVKNLSKSFDGSPALQGLQLEVPKGSVYGLVGPNGAGKATFLRCLAGVYRPDEGEILIDDMPVFENPDLKKRIAYIPDDLYYFVSASLKDMKAFYKGFYPTFDQQLFDKLSAVFPVDQTRPIRHLSKGMQKQAFFWLALSLRPEILLLDEPVDGLDPVMRRQLWSLILSDVEQSGVTVVVSSHNLRELEDVCDHVGVMDHGKLLLQRALSQLQEDFVKLQVVFRPEKAALPDDLPILHHSVTGKVNTFILRAGEERVAQAVRELDPIFYDILPLTLEEIFIYELGGADYAVKDIIL